jgi:membrane-bound lytic murein transglycosylase B
MSRFFIFILLSFLSLTAACAQDAPNAMPFAEWLQELKQDAASQGISQATIDAAFADAKPDDRVIQLDRKQPEVTLTPVEYLEKVVTDRRIEDGRDKLEDNRELLEKIGKRYGVQPRFIVALWGIETNYGKNTGGFSTINSLMTLAFDGRRADFFRDELIKALKILDSEHMSPDDMQGSWAGAMGQCQFMPTSFLKFAKDYDGDGKRDIWNSLPDVFASIANYLKSSGWNDNEGWGRPVKLPKKFDKSLADIKQEKTLAEWQRLGVRKSDGSNLPAKAVKASLIMVGEDKDARPYLIYGNYKVLLKWNRSRYFATAVGTLADALGK